MEKPWTRVHDVRKLARVGRGECSGRACPVARRLLGRQRWDSRHQGLALALTGISGHVHAADLAPGGCGGTLHLGLAISLRPVLPCSKLLPRVPHPMSAALWPVMPPGPGLQNALVTDVSMVQQQQQQQLFPSGGKAAASGPVLPSFLGTPLKLLSPRLADAYFARFSPTPCY